MIADFPLLNTLARALRRVRPQVNDSDIVIPNLLMPQLTLSLTLNETTPTATLLSGDQSAFTSLSVSKPSGAVGTTNTMFTLPRGVWSFQWDLTLVTDFFHTVTGGVGARIQLAAPSGGSIVLASVGANAVTDTHNGSSPPFTLAEDNWQVQFFIGGTPAGGTLLAQLSVCALRNL